MSVSAAKAGESGRFGFVPRRPSRLPGWLSRVEDVVGGAAFVGMTAMVFTNVVCRYLLNSPIAGSDELATLMFTWAVFLGASVGIRRQLHLGIEFITRLFPLRVRALCGLTVSLFMGGFAVLLLVYGWKLMRTAHLKLTPVLQWPYVWVYLAIPVGAILMLVRLLPIARGHLRQLAGRTESLAASERLPL